MPNQAAKAGKKHDRDGDVLVDDANSAAGETGAGASTNSFRNVSACNRCRGRKNKCDLELPQCSNCARVGARCVGFDPVSKREIPRSYVYYLEMRVHNLEALLQSHDIPYPPPNQDFAVSDVIKPGVNVPYPVQDDRSHTPQSPSEPRAGSMEAPFSPSHDHHPSGAPRSEPSGAAHAGVSTVRGVQDAKTSGLTSGISFAKVVSAAVRKSMPHPPPGAGSAAPKPSPADTPAGGDSFFGLYSKPTIPPAPFPDHELGAYLVDLYFQYANPQIPVLHRDEFMALFERVYALDPEKRTSRQLYMLNIVFAIGSGIIMDSSQAQLAATLSVDPDEGGPNKKPRRGDQHHQPEEYHSSAIVHLGSFLDSAPTSDVVTGGYEELQAVLLLAGLALLRPVAPGLWYIVGVAMRLSIDLGLHLEDHNEELDTVAAHPDAAGLSVDRKLGRKQWTRDLQRRLWWCTFNFDRLVTSCVGRPVSINEAVVTTQFASLLDDEFITPSGFLKAPTATALPSYKLVARHYLRLRLLQSEILQVLQFRRADHARRKRRQNPRIVDAISLASPPPDLICPYLERFDSFREWRVDMDVRLREWKDSAPRKDHTGVAFTPLFLELNYWQAVIMLYRQSLSVPEPLASELSAGMAGEDRPNPELINLEIEDDKQMVYLKVAQAGQTVVKIYRQLHRLKLVNYTFLATHHLFMSGISFLYAIWQSPRVRAQLTIDDVEFTVFVATSVLGDLIDKCPPAEACRAAFMRMSKATIQMVVGTTGFGHASTLATQRIHQSSASEQQPHHPHHHHYHRHHRQHPSLGQQDKVTSAPIAIPRRPIPAPQQFEMHAFTPLNQDMVGAAAAAAAAAATATQQHPVHYPARGAANASLPTSSRTLSPVRPADGSSSSSGGVTHDLVGFDHPNHHGRGLAASSESPAGVSVADLDLDLDFSFDPATDGFEAGGMAFSLTQLDDGAWTDDLGLPSPSDPYSHHPPLLSLEDLNLAAPPGGGGGSGNSSALWDTGSNVSDFEAASSANSAGPLEGNVEMMLNGYWFGPGGTGSGTGTGF